MITNFSEVFEQLKNTPKRKLAVAWGVDDHSICATSKAIDLGICSVTLYGSKAAIEEVCSNEKIDVSKFTIVDIDNEQKAIEAAVTSVHNKENDLLMKGLCSTDT